MYIIIYIIIIINYIKLLGYIRFTCDINQIRLKLHILVIILQCYKIIYIVIILYTLELL